VLIWVPSVLCRRLLLLAAHQPSVPSMAGCPYRGRPSSRKYRLARLPAGSCPAGPDRADDRRGDADMDDLFPEGRRGHSRPVQHVRHRMLCSRLDDASDEGFADDRVVRGGDLVVECFEGGDVDFGESGEGLDGVA
jgi:hypothetical protein